MKKHNWSIIERYCKNRGLTLEKEYKYVPGRKFKADGAILELRILIEVDGGIFTGRAHGSISGIKNDMERCNQATLNGWMRFRYTPQQFGKGQPIIDINKFINNRNIRDNWGEGG